MSGSFVLVPGAGGAAWYWHLVESELASGGHDVVAVDLPGEDPEAGLADYVDTVVDVAADRQDLVLVAQSRGASALCSLASDCPSRCWCLSTR